MADQNILREYLVSLGFRVNKTEQRNMDANVLKFDKRMVRLGAVAVSAAAAVVALTTKFAQGMEKMWYSARYAGTTVSAMQNLEYGARGIGLEGGKASAALKSMAQALRANPGLEGLLNSLGVQVKGRTMDKVLLDFVRATKGMPSSIAQQYAAMFGIDPETLFNMQEGLDQMLELAEKRKQMAKDMGVDSDKAAEKSKEFMNDWREVTEYVHLFSQAATLAFEGPIKDLMGASKELIKDWIGIVQEIGKAGAPAFWQKIREGMTGTAEGGTRAELTYETQHRLGDTYQGFRAPPGSGKVWQWREQFGRWMEKDIFTGKSVFDKGRTDAAAVDAATDPSGWNVNPGMTEAERVRLMRERVGGGVGQPDPSAALVKPGEDVMSRQAYLRALEQKFGLPPGILDRIWAKESARGKKLLSPKGAKGPFQFMDATAARFGVADPFNFEQSAEGAAKYLSVLQKEFHGDPRLMAGAYNAGEGRIRNYLLHRGEPLKPETIDYMNTVGGPPGTVINQDVNIYVTGTNDPAATARAVADEQRTVNADVTRNSKPRMR